MCPPTLPGTSISMSTSQGLLSFCQDQALNQEVSLPKMRFCCLVNSAMLLFPFESLVSFSSYCQFPAGCWTTQLGEDQERTGLAWPAGTEASRAGCSLEWDCWVIRRLIHQDAGGHTFNPSIPEAETGGCLWVRDQPGLQELVPRQSGLLHGETLYPKTNK